MLQTTILILDRNPHQKEYFISSFKEENISVREADSIKGFRNLFNPEENQIALLDYSSLVAEKREDIIQLFKALQNILSVVFNVPPDASKRLVFYELGALRVYDEQTSIEEVYRNIKWWMSVQGAQTDQDSADLQGQLSQIDFLKLLWGIAASEQDGILKIVTPRNIGYLFFTNGQISDAQVLNYTGLDAFLHISLWEQGHYLFKKGNASNNNRHSIYLTMPGLMILAQDLRAELESMLQEFKSEASVLQAINLGDLALYDLKLNPEFLEFLSIPRKLGDVLENPFYSNHQTLKILNKLKRFGLLRMNAPIESIIQASEGLMEGIKVDRQMVSQIGGDVEKLKRLKQKLKLQEGQPAKIIVISEDGELLKHFLNSLAGSPEKVLFDNNMYVVRLSITENYEIILIGIPANHQLLRLLSLLSEQLHGFLFLINAKNSRQTEYYSYLINQVIAQYSAPAACAATYLDAEESIDQIRKKFLLSAALPWVAFKANNPQEMLEAISRIEPVEPVEVEVNKQNGEKE